MLFQTRIKELEAELSTAQQNLTTLTAERDELSGTVTAHAADITRLTNDLQVRTSERDDLQTRLTVSEESIETKVRERIASAGVPAIERTEAKGDPADPADEPADPRAAAIARANANWSK